eukprot:Sspe_Gene.43450::Locus_21179_Transcript_1_1_Confidence_1.000_Length_1018::g.43450::m.43450
MPRLVRFPSPSLLILYWFAVDAWIAIFNWWFCLSQSSIRDVAAAASNAHVTFALVGFLVYFTLASSLLYYPHHFKPRLEEWDRIVNRPNHRKELGRRAFRQNTVLGIWSAFFSGVLPRFIIEMHIVYEHGWFYVLQGIALIVTFVSAFLGFLTVWTSWMWKASKRLQLWGMNGMTEVERMAYLEAYRTGPYAIHYGPKGQPVWVAGSGFGFLTATNWAEELPPVAEGMSEIRRRTTGVMLQKDQSKSDTGKPSARGEEDPDARPMPTISPLPRTHLGNGSLPG